MRDQDQMRRPSNAFASTRRDAGDLTDPKGADRPTSQAATGPGRRLAARHVSPRRAPTFKRPARHPSLPSPLPIHAPPSPSPADSAIPHPAKPSRLPNPPPDPSFGRRPWRGSPQPPRDPARRRTDFEARYCRECLLLARSFCLVGALVMPMRAGACRRCCSGGLAARRVRDATYVSADININIY
ncbi:hypothetical protein PAHAL_1G051800 [Panicum hallii]|uniref:Uncharacterized protein n=1 Tax=Panicum hallii TaxID=206008 RepID=A0A2T8KU44_9POAL|nr:hypothetical protein PAHAL_1G051800 [Panicum hallii]